MNKQDLSVKSYFKNMLEEIDKLKEENENLKNQVQELEKLKRLSWETIKKITNTIQEQQEKLY